MLSQAKASPDIPNYLSYILCSDSSSLGLSNADGDLARCAAAISLKNTVKTRYESLSASSQSYIRSCVLQCLQDSNDTVRSYAGNVITELVSQGGILSWPEIIPELLALANNEKGNIQSRTQEGAMSALFKICEDNKKALDSNYLGQRPLDVLLPRLYQTTSSPIARVRAMALESINLFIPQKPHALLSTLDAFLPQLFNLAMDPDDSVRRFVCRAFVQLLDVRPDSLLPHMDGLVTYMVTQQRNTDDPSLALDAAEFWLSVGEHNNLCASLGPYLNTIIPTLLESMVYSEEDIARLEGERDDAELEDREQDIKPQFAKSKIARLAGDKSGANNVNNRTEADLDDDDLSEGEIAEDDEDGGDPEDEWNLRKCSAAALDVLANHFHQPVFDVSLPYLKDNLKHKNWPNREAAVLAIGAVAEGCMDTIAPHLPELVPYLNSLLNDKEPVVRKITCWALGRYSRWAAHLPQQQKQMYYEPMMDGILKRMLDGNKSVQEAAASAFSSLEESSGNALLPYCRPIIQQFVQCFNVYKDRNMFILYDCVQTLAEMIGPTLAEPELLDQLMPAIITRWSIVSDQSQELFPLLECLSYVAPALGDAFSPYAQPIFSRCIKMIHQNLEQQMLADSNSAYDKPDQDVLVTSLDLLSSIIQALPQPKSGELVANSQPKMFDLLQYCMTSPEIDVRQSSYALLGDCAIYLFSYLQPSLPTLMPILIQQLDADSLPDEEAGALFSVINNACWSCGEISIQEQRGMTVYVEKLYERFSAIILDAGMDVSVSENAAIALGRISISCADLVAPRLGDYAKRFLNVIEPVHNTDEKFQALIGLNQTIALNPQGMADCLVEYLSAAARCATGESRQLPQLRSSFETVSSEPYCRCSAADLHSGLERLQSYRP